MDQIKRLRLINRVLIITVIIFSPLSILMAQYFRERDYYDPNRADDTYYHTISLENSFTFNNLVKDQISIYNYGKPIYTLLSSNYVLVTLDSKCPQKSKTKGILLKGFYTVSTYQYDHATDQFPRTTNDKNLVLITGGGKNNNLIWRNLSDKFHQETSCYLQKTIYLKIKYDDESYKSYTEFYKIDDNGTYKIDNLSGENIIENLKNIPIVDLRNTTTQEISELFGIKAE